MRASGDSWQLRNLFPRVLRGDHAPGFTAANLRKDLGHAADLAGAPLTMGDPERTLFADVPGELDYGAVARVLMDLPTAESDGDGRPLLRLREQHREVRVTQAVGADRQAEVVIERGRQRAGTDRAPPCGRAGRVRLRRRAWPHCAAG